MITTLLRLYLAITSSLTADAADESAHHACEVAVYAVVAPGLPDDEDATTPLGEALADVLCRHDLGMGLGPWEDPAPTN